VRCTCKLTSYKYTCAMVLDFCPPSICMGPEFRRLTRKRLLLEFFPDQTPSRFHEQTPLWRISVRALLGRKQSRWACHAPFWLYSGHGSQYKERIQGPTMWLATKTIIVLSIRFHLIDIDWSGEIFIMTNVTAPTTLDLISKDGDGGRKYSLDLFRWESLV
jgi:hypothetical protein